MNSRSTHLLPRGEVGLDHFKVSGGTRSVNFSQVDPRFFPANVHTPGGILYS